MMTLFPVIAGQSQQFGGWGMGAHDPKRMGLGASSQRDVRDKNIKISLENRDLWQKFHSLGTEMIITKTGRSVILKSLNSNEINFINSNETSEMQFSSKKFGLTSCQKVTVFKFSFL